MVAIVKRFGTDPGTYFSHAAANINREIGDVAQTGAKNAQYIAKLRAPISFPFRYPSWIGYKNQHKRGGKLKNSIRVRKGGWRSNVTFKTGIYSLVKYSSYQENGFTHRKAHKYVHGKKFMKTGVLFGFELYMKTNINFAFKRAFATGEV